MTLPLYASFIDGKTVECAQSFFDLVTPHDGGIIGRIAESGRDGVEIAVKAVSLAFARHRRQVNLLVLKVAPAIAAGNAIVVKPARQVHGPR